VAGEITAEVLAALYCNTMNVIHYMHDRYNYERLEMALHDTEVRRLLAFGISGLSVAADSLSAIRHARVTPVLDARGLMTEFRVEGAYPKYGNDDERVDGIARELVTRFNEKLQQHFNTYIFKIEQDEYAREGVPVDLIEFKDNQPTLDMLQAAMDLQQSHSISFWDALIVQTASAARCRVLYSEDMQAGSRIGNVLIVNPFT
jgi:hypothetical protein